jgi:hypothetical protein
MRLRRRYFTSISARLQRYAKHCGQENSIHLPAHDSLLTIHVRPAPARLLLFCIAKATMVTSVSE